MKINRNLKYFFYLMFGALYLTGVLRYLLSFFSGEFGPTPLGVLSLQAHGILSLGFLVFFGYFLAAHVLPSLRQQRHRVSGIIVNIGVIVLSLTVPFLYYGAGDSARNVTIWIHTYFGMAIVIPLVFHIVKAVRSRRFKRTIG
jgi:hypothetical protein